MAASSSFMALAAAAAFVLAPEAVVASPHGGPEGELRWWTDLSADGRAFGSRDLDFPSGVPRMRFSCTVEETSRDPANPGHWNFNLKDAEGNLFHFHATEKYMQAWIDSSAGTRLAYGMTRFEKMDYPAPFRIDFTPCGVVAALGNGARLQLPRGFDPVDGKAGFYRVAGTMTGMKVERMPPPAKGKVFDEEMGGAMFWCHYKPIRRMMRFVDASGGEVGRLEVGAGGYVRFVGSSSGGAPIEVRRRVCEEWTRAGESLHVAFSWRPDGSGRLYVNGLPFAPDMRSGEMSDALMLGNRMAETARVETFDVEDVVTVRRPLSNEEVYAAYRSRNPFDFQFVDSPVPAGRPAAVKISAYPGGTFLKGVPYDGFRPFTGTRKVSLSVARIEKGGAVRIVPVPEATRTYGALPVTGETPIETSPATLLPGKYRLAVSVGDNHVLYRYFRAAEPVVLPSATPSDDTWRLGEVRWRRRFAAASDVEFSAGGMRTGQLGEVPYLEAGTNGSLNGDRYGVVVPFAQDRLGKPCCIEILWPDDKARSMAFAMHPETFSPRETYHRDRLQCGVFAGDAYRNTGAMQTVRYLFYPFTTNYLFEVRTLIDARPAAVAAVRIRDIDGEWPVLKVREPAGYPPRRFGYQDEDQTFFHNLNADYNRFNQEKIASETLKYLAYTGQNAFHYPLARYSTTLGPVECSLGGGGNDLWPGRTGEMGPVVRNFTAARVDWIGEVYMGRTCEDAFAHLIDSRRAQDGWFSLDWHGEGASRFDRAFGNIASPAYLNSYFDNFIPYAGYLASCGMKGVRHWFGANRGGIEFGMWSGLDCGYDDWTVDRFAAETKTDLPPDCRAGPRRFESRFRFLCAGDASVRSRWLRWRADRVTDFVRLYRDRLDKAAPGLPLTLVFDPSGKTVQSLYETNGVDLVALGGVKGVTYGLDRSPVGYLFQAYRRRKKPDEAKERMVDDAILRTVREIDGGAVSMVCEHNVYFETFRNSLCPSRFNTYFQSFDVKPNGRHFLKAFAYDVGMMDALSVTVGDQPIGTLGAENEAREFAKAFRALPAVPFEDVPGFGAEGGTVVRRFRAKDGTYWYAVNMTDRATTLRPPFAGAATDLSTGRTDAFTQLELRPYELRSFHQPKRCRTKGTEE